VIKLIQAGYLKISTIKISTAMPDHVMFCLKRSKLLIFKRLMVEVLAATAGYPVARVLKNGGAYLHTSVVSSHPMI